MINESRWMNIYLKIIPSCQSCVPFISKDWHIEDRLWENFIRWQRRWLMLLLLLLLLTNTEATLSSKRRRACSKASKSSVAKKRWSLWCWISLTKAEWRSGCWCSWLAKSERRCCSCLWEVECWSLSWCVSTKSKWLRLTCKRVVSKRERTRAGLSKCRCWACCCKGGCLTKSWCGGCWRSKKTEPGS